MESQMRHNALFYFLSAVLLGLVLSASAVAQTRTPPSDIFVDAVLNDKSLMISQKEITLTRTEYYRLNFSCDSDVSDIELNFDVAKLVQDSHVRILTVDNIQVYLQGLHFRALQCEGKGSVKFSFYPMRSGTYKINISDEDNDVAPQTITINVK